MSVANATECYYCAIGHAMKEAAKYMPPQRHPLMLITIHDRRGCLHMCWAHARWRLTTSTMGGHEEKCPLAKS